jgi:hypothetical protein
VLKLHGSLEGMMNRFGSSKLRIVWASVSIFLFGLFFVGFSTSSGPDGFAIHAFGATISQDLLASMSGLADPAQLLRSALRAFIVWSVPFTFLVSAYPSIVDAIEAYKLRGYFLGGLFGAAHGFYYSQLLILPIWAICARLLGSIVPSPLALADLHALILGAQLLIWSIIFNRLIKSNKGVSLALTLGFGAIGTKLYYLVDFGEMLGMKAGQVKVAEFFYHFLPSQRVPESPISSNTLLIGLIGPLVISVLLVLLPFKRK